MNLHFIEFVVSKIKNKKKSSKKIDLKRAFWQCSFWRRSKCLRISRIFLFGHILLKRKKKPWLYNILKKEKKTLLVPDVALYSMNSNRISSSLYDSYCWIIDSCKYDAKKYVNQIHRYMISPMSWLSYSGESISFQVLSQDHYKCTSGTFRNKIKLENKHCSKLIAEK